MIVSRRAGLLRHHARGEREGVQRDAIRCRRERQLVPADLAVGHDPVHTRHIYRHHRRVLAGDDVGSRVLPVIGTPSCVTLMVAAPPYVGG